MPTLPTLPFPGVVVGPGATNRATVLAIQHRLNLLACGPLTENGAYDAATVAAVELFQTRSVDKFGVPLKVDGKVGPMTWGALFQAHPAPVTKPQSPLLEKVLAVAAAEVGQMENPLGSNRGPKVDLYLRAVGLNPAGGSFAWCAAFVYWCFQTAAQSLTARNPLIQTAGVTDHWNRAVAAGVPHVDAAAAAETPSLVQPGMIFVITFPSGTGHTGLVEAVDGVRLTTIEGNTNDGGSREGIGVFRRDARSISQISRGFLHYS
jgi:hypothetical protein